MILFFYIDKDIDNDGFFRLAAEKRREERRKQRYEEKREQRLGPVRDKMAEYKAKESATIEMFKQMAEEQRRRGAF